MAFVVKDRVQETSTTTGTGTFTLAGATAGFSSFSVIGDANTTYYTITANADWEVGIGTYTSSGTTLSRDTVLASSNSNNLVDFPAGTKNVFVVYPAGRAVIVNGSTVEVPNSATLPVTAGGTGSSTATFSGANITSLNASSISTGTLANARTTASSSNGASTIVARDASGDFSARTITGTVSVNAPIFYDSGNTSFYVDPAPGTNGISANFQGRIQLGTFNNSQSNSGEAWLGRASDRNAGTFTVQLGGGSSSGRSFEVVDYNWTTVLFSVGSNGVAIASSDMRAPIFYDNNNTGYYLDPASTTSLRTVGDWRSDSSTWTGEFSGKIQYHSNHWYIQAADLLIYRSSGGNNVFTINQSGVAIASGDMRAPIFYDSNNTGYYVDPANYFILLRGRVGPYAGSQSGNTSALEIMNNGGTGDSNLANITFHCQSQYGTSLHLRPDGYFGVGGWSATNWRWYTYLVNGDMTAAGNVTAYSDPRLKTDIKPIQSALSIVQQLNGVKFKWIESSVIGHPGEYDYGVLADQVQKVLPELVSDSMHEAPEGDKYKTVAYDKFAPILIEAVKELTKYTTVLEQRISQLELRNE